MDLTVASFFSGIGLLDLGLEWAGWRTVSFSEIDPYASRVLDARFPGVPNLGDITELQPESIPEATLWAGGFPCQPLSTAGKRLAQDDERWLWPEWARLIRVVRPPVLLLENVRNLLAINGGGALAEVLRDLAESGYDTEWDCIPASAVGAPHQRDRVWIVAYANSQPVRVGAGSLDGTAGAGEGEGAQRQRFRPNALNGGAGSGNVAYADSLRGYPWARLSALQRAGLSDPDGSGRSSFDPERPMADASRFSEARPETKPRPKRQRTRQGREQVIVADSQGISGELRPASRKRPGRSASGGIAVPDTRSERGQLPAERRFPAEQFLGRNDPPRSDLGGDWWATERGLGRVVDGQPHRVDRLRCLGNAVVPHIPYWIGLRLRELIEMSEAA